jgi:hypothetical protein
MISKRTPERHKKRLSVHFGIEEANRVAFTEDISINGMFIRSCNVCPPNTKIKVEFSLENNAKVILEARVMWAKKVPQNLFHLVRKSGMGLRFLRFISGREHFERFCDNLTPIR